MSDLKINYKLRLLGGHIVRYYNNTTITMKNIIAFTSLIGLVSAQSISSWVNERWSDDWACKSECTAWVDNVSTCVGNLNMTFAASINTADLSSFQSQGDLSAISGCVCHETAISASESCIKCASDALCLSPAIQVADYQNLCQNPMNGGWKIWKQYHGKSFCKSGKSGKSNTYHVSGSGTVSINSGGSSGGSSGNSDSSGNSGSSGGSSGASYGSGSGAGDDCH